MSAAMESEVIRRVNDVVDERPVTPHIRNTAGSVANGSHTNGSGSNGSQTNGLQTNGLHTNGSNGSGSGGSGSGGSGSGGSGSGGSGSGGSGSGGSGSTPSIADRFADLLAPLSNRRRRGLIARLSVGYYEGWRPSRAEVTELVAEELRRSPR
ncbi:hypothetical protein ACVBEQ_16240 [Nakamurella sp. GG22]